MRVSRRHAFSLIELLIVIGIIGLLLAILLPALEHVRHRSYIDVCANNLRQIGQAMGMYANDNSGALPRTTYDASRVAQSGWTAGNDAAVPIPFGGTGHVANDVTSAVFWLMRTQALPPATFICPYNDVNVFVPEDADPLLHGNFTDYRKNLGYSFADMYPTPLAAERGYRWINRQGSEFAMAADLNPGIHAPDDDPTAVIANSPPSIMTKGNSRNHEKEGQNVLYGDGHVTFEYTCLCGMAADNIYVSRDGRIDLSPADKDDSLLVPTN